uniref:Uncharacterized protein n=1 Tax=uncultured prokaryote TaxID=198431 RepID=A0A0H5Q5R9_9ZZZZ|nr:hypothetical protein [uncultured prokaryote]
MTHSNFKFDGCFVNGERIRLYFVETVGGVKYQRVVSAPVEDVLTDEVCQAAYAAAAKRLRLAWAVGEPGPALFE